MTTQTQVRSTDEALKLALEALELMYACYVNPKWVSHRQQESQILEQTLATITAIKAALEAHKALMSVPDGAQPEQLEGLQLIHKADIDLAKKRAIEAQPAVTESHKQEPVLYLVNGIVQSSDIPEGFTGCLYTTPQQRKEPDQEPVAWLHEDGDVITDPLQAFQASGKMKPLYTAPPQHKPLTDEELRLIENKINPNMRWRSSDEEGITLYPQEYYELVRAIEAAHGIKE